MARARARYASVLRGGEGRMYRTSYGEQLSHDRQVRASALPTLSPVCSEPFFYAFAKRLIDVFLAGGVLLALAPIYAAFVFDRPLPIAWLALFMVVLVYFRHAENIRRLLKGEEPRIGGKKDAA